MIIIQRSTAGYLHAFFHLGLFFFYIGHLVIRLNCLLIIYVFFFFFSSRRRHTRSLCDWSSDVCSSDLVAPVGPEMAMPRRRPRIRPFPARRARRSRQDLPDPTRFAGCFPAPPPAVRRSEERRVGEEGRSRWSPDH